jgi:hypothetical protein
MDKVGYDKEKSQKANGKSANSELDATLEMLKSAQVTSSKFRSSKNVRSPLPLPACGFPFLLFLDMTFFRLRLKILFEPGIERQLGEEFDVEISAQMPKV